MDVDGTDFDAYRVAFPDSVDAEFCKAYGVDRWNKIKHALAIP